jgi:hypothetical protein
MKQFSQGLSKTADLPIRPAPERHGREAQADQRATQALGNGMLRSPLSAPQRSLPNWQTTGNPLPEQGGHSLSPTLRAPFEQGFGHDFSQVRIFPAGETAEAVHKAGSRAITCGPPHRAGARPVGAGNADRPRPARPRTGPRHAAGRRRQDADRSQDAGRRDR